MNLPGSIGAQYPSPGLVPGASAVLAPDEVRLLTEVGFLAAAAGDVARAENIFGALGRIRPDRLFPSLGLAIAWMNAGRASDAADLLEKAACADSEEQAICAAWRGFALQLAGRSAQSRSVLQKAVEDHGASATFARGLLGLDRDMP